MSVLIGSEIAVAQDERLPTDEVERLMRQRISHYLAGRDDPSLYQSLRNMSQFVSDDYGNRFLVELIQNAHDAHAPVDRNGEIAVVLDIADGSHGCLYVANRGAGFVASNLKAITNIALSSKPVNAGIGNKGLGFRSVLQICNWPEIYSVQGNGGSGVFDGYCFRFATVEDLRAQLRDEPDGIAEEMAGNLPCWHVPVPVKPGPNVARFAADGFATVVRLPLKSADALDAVREQIRVLMELKTPLHLFLDRVGRIAIEGGEGGRFVLQRSVEQTWTLHPPGFKTESPVEVAKVDLGGTMFVLAHWDIDDKLFKDALQASLQRNEVPESWREWQGAARVSVAVPLGTPLDAGRLYCFLPLGEEGKAPFAGYLNANFYTKLDRQKVDASIRLNDLFMRMAAWLSCQLIGFIVKNDWAEGARAVVSLLCWDTPYTDTLKHAMGNGGQGVLTREFLPVRGPRGSTCWASPQEAYSWVGPLDACLSPERVSDFGGGRILADSLTRDQRAALDELYVRLRSRNFAPPADVVAAWVERIAGQMQKEAAAPESWAKLYDEVAAAFAGNPSALFGKKFLLSVNSDLISSELPAGTGSSGRSRRAADVYFAPVMSVDADVDDDESKQSLPLERLPATLRKGFALLNRDVPWLKDDGGHRPGRSFLISAKLAREYDTRDVLRTLAGVTRTSESEHTRAQALEWAFRLWNSGRSLSDKETRAAGFFVPTAEGWIPAEAAMFGGGWDTPNGKKLHALLRAAADSSPDLMQCQRRLLPEYQSWPIRHGPQADWLRFLAAAGVADCLRPVGGESVAFEKIGYPANLPEAISRAVAGMPEAVRAHWSTQLAQDCLHMFSSRQYRAEVRPWRIPGQDDHDKLAPEIRREYAVQIVLAMRVLSDEHRTFRAVRANTGAAATEPHRMSTPLSAFLTGAEWLPVTRPGGRPRFVKPGAAWYFQAEDERPPRFIDFIAHPVTSAIDAAVLEWLRDRAQLGVFNDQKHAGRALLALSEATSTRITDIRDVRRFQDLFRRLWANVRHAGSPQPATRVPVHLRGEISGVSKTDGDIAKAYFDDGRDGLKKQLLEEVGEPVFDFVEGDATAVWNWINASTPGRFHRISDEPAEIFVDGSKYDDGTVGQPLSEIVGGWIIDFVVCVAEHKGSAFVQSTQNTLGKIRRAAMALTLVSGQEIQIAHGDERLPLPASLRGALALQRPHGPVLIVQSEGVVTLAQLAEGAGQLAVALGSRELANGFEAALLRLSAAQRDDTGAPPDDATIAAALGVDLDALKETRRLASGDLGSMLDLAIPLSACKGSPDITARLLDLAAQEDPDEGDLRAGLEALATVLGSSLPELEERMRHLVDLSDLKAEFALPIAQLNEAVATLGGRYKPVSNEGSHRDAWTRHLRQRLPMTVERLRERAVARFDRGEPLTPYASARDGALLVQPDSTWFTTYDELPEAVMDARIDRWVDDCLPANQAEVPLDATLGEVRASNGARLREFWTKFSPLLSAWIRTPTAAASAGVRQAWMNPETTRDTFAARARDSGWFDFRVLDDDRIAAWLTLEGAWPGGRPASVDLDVWGISAEAIVTSEERAKAERAEQQRRRTQVEFAGTKMSALAEAYDDLAKAVTAAAAHAPALEGVSPTEAALETMEPAKPSGGTGGGKRGDPVRTPESGMSDEQKQAVGLIGELWAGEWLRRRHHLERVDESIWVSKYRDLVLKTSGGSDLLGYDFIVATKSRTYYYEVKASTGDPLRFEMGPTEIVAGNRYRADREHRYRILYLANVGDPTRMTPTLLANPFSVKGAGKFRAVGRGSVLYEFDPTH